MKPMIIFGAVALAIVAALFAGDGFDSLDGAEQPRTERLDHALGKAERELRRIAAQNRPEER